MADRPTRSRPSRKKGDTESAEEKTQAAATKKAASPTNGRKKAAATAGPEHALYYEDDLGTLTPLGSYAGRKASNVLEAYLEALEDGDRQGAIDAQNYAVVTNRGLERIAIQQTIDIVSR